VKSILILLLAATLAHAGDPGLDSLKKNGQWKRIRDQVEARLKVDPQDAAMILWQARVQEAFQQTEKACATARKATEKAPQSADAWAELASVSGQMAAQAGLMSKWGFAKDCKGCAEKALALDSHHLQALEVLVAFHQQAPGMVGGDKALAETYKKTLASLDPDFSYSQEINQAYASKDRGRMLASVLKAVAGRPQEAWPLRLAARHHLDPASLNAQEAEGFARRAIALQPDNAEGYVLLVQSLAMGGKWKDVDEALALVERKTPDNLTAYYTLGRTLLVNNGDPKRAEACFRRYLGVDPEAGSPDRAAAHWRLGLSLEKQGHKPEALQQIEISLKIRPDFKEAKADFKRLS